MAAYKDCPISQLVRDPNDWSQGERLNKQELNAIFTDSESSYDARLIVPTSKSAQSIFTRLESQDVLTHCSNSLCNKKLIFHRRSCYLCGRDFCFECTSHYRELGGSLRQTCAPCFADLHVRQQPGLQKDLKGFLCMKRGAKKTQPQNRFQKPVPSDRRNRFAVDANKELERLCEGFSESTSTRLRSSFSELVSTAKMPKWQQGKFWQPGSEVRACYTCRKELSFLRLGKQFCRVCGRVFCSECTSPLLMLYKDAKGSAEWAINGLEGCPTDEPPVFQLLRICRSCQLQAERLLIERSVDVEKGEELETNMGFMDKLRDLYTLLLKHKLHVLRALPSFVRRVEALAAGNSSDSDLARELSKQQRDLSDHFSLLAVELQSFHSLEAASSRQHAILSNVSKAFLSFHHEHMPTFRCVTRDLHDIFTPDVMDIILEHNNYSTLNSIYLVVRQLCLELTYVLSELSMSQDLFDKLVEASEVILVELRSVVEKRGEDWEAHKSAISDMVKTQCKQKPFVFVGKRKGLYTEKKIYQKVEKKLLFCIRILEARTDEKSFVNSKRTLTSVLPKKVLHRGVTV